MWRAGASRQLIGAETTTAGAGGGRGQRGAARTIRELLALLTRENSQNLMEDAT